MAECHPTSKLKRKKACVENLHTDKFSRDSVKRDQPTLFFSDRAAQTAGSVRGGGAAVEVPWWNREQLPAVESLWGFTLKSALPYLENQAWSLVPDLPHPSTAESTALKLHEQMWCDLRQEVTPFPEPTTPRLSTLSSPDPLRLGSSQQDLSVQTKPAPHTSDGQSPSHKRQSHDGDTTSLAKRQLSSLHSRKEMASSEGCLSLNREKGSKEEQEKEEEEMQGGVRADEGGGGGRLQSCPMCLLEFPVGFTQMDCDGHLAQCLSEMHVDMTW